MTKQAFAAALRNELSGLPREDIDRSIDFYCEMIDDRMEEGLTEEEAVSAIGSVSVSAPSDGICSTLLKPIPCFIFCPTY